MLHIKNNSKGLTLTELLVSTILIGIVMSGVTAFNYTVKSIEDANSKAAIVESRATSLLAFLRRDIERAVGTRNNHGIRGGQYGNWNTLCLRHDNAMTPDDFLDDDWICYQHGSSEQLHRITNPEYFNLSNPTGRHYLTDPTLPTGRCGSSGQPFKNCMDGGPDGHISVGHLIQNNLNNNSTSFFEIIYDNANNIGDTGIIGIDIRLNLTSDNQAPTSDRLRQARQTIETRIFPVSHGR